VAFHKSLQRARDAGELLHFLGPAGPFASPSTASRETKPFVGTEQATGGKVRGAQESKRAARASLPARKRASGSSWGWGRRVSRQSPRV
jgi:hypothetical protein